MKHRYLSTKVILPVADGSVLLAPEVLDISIVVDPPGIVVVLGTCDAGTSTTPSITGREV
jgi:hypothetical protein